MKLTIETNDFREAIAIAFKAWESSNCEIDIVIEDATVQAK